MAKRVKKRSSKNKLAKENFSLNADIAGVILIAFGIFSFISLIEPEFGGILGQGLFSLLIFLLGMASVLFPFISMFLGYCYIKTSGNIKYSIKAYGFALLIFAGLLLVGQRTIELYSSSSFLQGAGKLFRAKTMLHGGIVSYTILTMLNSLIGTIGSYIVILATFIISISMILNKSIKELFPKENVAEKIKRKKQDLFKAEENYEDDTYEKVEKETEVKKARKYNIFKTLSTLDEEENEEKPMMEIPKDIKVEDSHEVLKKTKNNEVESDDEVALEQEIQESASLAMEEYIFPDISFLRENLNSKLNKSDKKELISSATKLEDTLESFGVNAKVIQVSRGPAVTRYELQPSVGVKVNKIVNLADDIALNLAASGVRIEAPIPGKAAVGIEVPNKEVAAVYLKEIIESTTFRDNKKNISFALGKDISGSSVVADLTKMPHLLIAGATGSGKSVCINTLIISILYKYSPNDVKLIMVDPKMVELSMYNGIPHLLVPVVTNPKKAAGALNWAVNEMTRRYETFAENNVRNIEGYNDLYEKGKIADKMQWIVIIIDELADLMMVCPKDIEDYIARLAQMARAAGMHLVIATQRPSVDVITGVIKANIPSRISFAVSSQIDSRTILDSSGAEKLLGRGDMLYYPVGENKPLRVQGAFISEEEVEMIVRHIKSQKQEVEYKEELLEQINSKGQATKEGEEDDDLLNEAIKIVVENGQASTSFLQRKLRIGFNRASRIMEELEEKEIISKRDGSKPRRILISEEELDL